MLRRLKITPALTWIEYFFLLQKGSRLGRRNQLITGTLEGVELHVISHRGNTLYLLYESPVSKSHPNYVPLGRLFPRIVVFKYYLPVVQISSIVYRLGGERLMHHDF